MYWPNYNSTSRHYTKKERRNIENTSECLLISSLPGKALITLVDIATLASDSTCILKAEPGTRDIKRRESGILFITLTIVSLFKVANMT